MIVGRLLGIPLAFYYTLALWYVFEYTAFWAMRHKLCPERGGVVGVDSRGRTGTSA